MCEIRWRLCEYFPKLLVLTMIFNRILELYIVYYIPTYAKISIVNFVLNYSMFRFLFTPHRTRHTPNL